MPDGLELGDELHHFGWNACSSALCPDGGHDHGDRRYLIVPGLRSSRLYVLGATSTWPTTCGGTSTTTSRSPRSGAPRP